MTPLEEAEREWRLRHIVDACDAIIEYTRSRTFDDYQKDRMLRRAFERELMVIGEAVGRLANVDPDISSQISDVRAIISFRNKIVHDYPDLDDVKIWNIVMTDIPTLLAEVRALLPPGET